MPAGANGEWTAEYIDFLAGRRPDLAREHFLRDQHGKPLGGPTLQTRLDWLDRLEAFWNAAESKAAQSQAVLARAFYKLAGSADVLADRIGREDALAVLQAAGYDPGPVARRWDDHAPPKREPHDIYAGDPLYHPRVLAALGPGGSTAEAADIGAETTAARRREQEEAIAEVPEAAPDFMWKTRTGEYRTGQAQRAHKALRDDVPRGRPADLPASSPPWEA